VQHGQRCSDLHGGLLRDEQLCGRLERLLGGREHLA